MLTSITWPVAISFVGTLVILATFLASYVKKNESPWSKDLKALEDKLEAHIRSIDHRLIVAEGALDEIKRRLDEIKEEINANKAATGNKFDKTEEKLEKITQLVIDILQKF